MKTGPRVEINGVPANSTSDGQFDPARISTAGIREIKVSYGSSSVLGIGPLLLRADLAIEILEAPLPDVPAIVATGDDLL